MNINENPLQSMKRPINLYGNPINYVEIIANPINSIKIQSNPLVWRLELASCFKYQVPGTWRQVPGAWDLPHSVEW